MLPIAVFDDEPLHALRTRTAILDHADGLRPDVRLFETPEALLQAVEEGYSPRIAFLDIQTDGSGGISLAEELNRRLPGCAVIFLTAFLEYATDVYETRHVYFILKSQLEQRVGDAIRRALSAQSAPELLCFRAGSAYRTIPCREVLFLERILHKTRIVCQSGEEQTAALPSQLLSGPAGQDFIRCHQSYWVNFFHIRAMEHGEFLLSNGGRIPISRTYRAAAREQFFRCLQKTEAAL